MAIRLIVTKEQGCNIHRGRSLKRYGWTNSQTELESRLSVVFKKNLEKERLMKIKDNHETFRYLNKNIHFYFGRIYRSMDKVILNTHLFWDFCRKKQAFILK